jgi:hypothetical protein
MVSQRKKEEAELAERFRSDCPCPKKKCPRHGYCEECEAYHGAKGKLPYCTRKKNKGHGMMSRAEAQEMDRSKSGVLVLRPA